MRQINATTLRAHLDETLKAVSSGEEVEITYRNQPIVRMVPIRNEQRQERMAGLDKLIAFQKNIDIPQSDKSFKELYHEHLDEKYG